MPPKPKEPKPPVWAAECPNGINIFDEEEKEYQQWCEYLLNDEFACAWVRLLTEQRQFFRKTLSQLRFNAAKLLKYPVGYAIVMINDCWDSRTNLKGGWLGIENSGTDKRYKEWLASKKYEELIPLLSDNKINDPFAGDIKIAWDYWRAYVFKHYNFEYCEASEQIAIDELFSLSGGNPEEARLMIKNSISKRWKNFYGTERQQQATEETQQFRSEVQKEFDRYFNKE